MNESIEIFTKSKTFDDVGEINKLIHHIRTEVTDVIVQSLARYICDEPNGKKIVVELHISSKWCKDKNIGDFACLSAYEFSGKLPDYANDILLKNIDFNYNWQTAIQQMKELAMSIMTKWNNITCNDFDEETHKYNVTAYKTNNPDEKGTIIAKIDLADKTVEYLDETAKTDDYAKEVISEMLKNGYVLTE